MTSRIDIEDFNNKAKSVYENEVVPQIKKAKEIIEEDEITMKQEVLVKLAGSMVYNKRIDIDPNNLTNILKFPKEVFADIDGIRIAIMRVDYEQLIKNIK
jgi:hypothetical protein